MPEYSGFIQNEITLNPKLLKLTLGTKVLNNVYSGMEWQPCLRLAWTPNETNTIWTSVSRSVRIPTRLNVDVVPSAVKFKSEKVVAYELGYRVQPMENLSLSMASFYNVYRDLRSLDSNSIPSPPIIFANNQEAESWGFEFSGLFQVTKNWRLRGGFTYFDREITATNPKVLPISEAFESLDQKFVSMLQSTLDLPHGFQINLNARYATALKQVLPTIPEVPDYFTFDTRLSWQIKQFELSVLGQNLFENRHLETGSATIPRSIQLRLNCRF